MNESYTHSDPGSTLLSISVNWILTDGVLRNKTFISLINVETHGASLSSCVYLGVVIIGWPGKKRGAIIERPRSHCAIVPALLVVICRALHLITIRQTADGERLKRQICCLVWAQPVWVARPIGTINTGSVPDSGHRHIQTPKGAHAAGLPSSKDLLILFRKLHLKLILQQNGNVFDFWQFPTRFTKLYQVSWKE